MPILAWRDLHGYFGYVLFGSVKTIKWELSILHIKIHEFINKYFLKSFFILKLFYRNLPCLYYR